MHAINYEFVNPNARYAFSYSYKKLLRVEWIHPLLCQQNFNLAKYVWNNNRKTRKIMLNT